MDIYDKDIYVRLGIACGDSSAVWKLGNVNLANGIVVLESANMSSGKKGRGRRAIDGVTFFQRTNDEDCPPLPSVLTVHPRGRTCSPQRSELSPVPC